MFGKSSPKPAVRFVPGCPHRWTMWIRIEGSKYTDQHSGTDRGDAFQTTAKLRASAQRTVAAEVGHVPFEVVRFEAEPMSRWV
ncbi:hypothetical protein [Streptomyces albireticuli]|uniref:Uncharacterized protein n=1 Tax=Streptomyces albireticuli TaxID=1940 RepID=A0A2A2D536_9ACTN|nr:hypothetical protein [Streptomyces albireticuli]MCD9196053.1 hypothetical protein [Streptomyces albireticuli]PAU46557.1 hypothetical protein CK936_23475 [Streptomyces albireticuli]